jgi:SAM-dependent methyltransferase
MRLDEWVRKVPNCLSFPSYLRELKKAVGMDCKTLLDVGCGSDSPTKAFSRRFYSVGIDANKSSLEKSKKTGIHNEYFHMAFSELYKFEPCAFDCVVALDVIEHLKKADGFRLLDNIERIAKKKIIVFTPNGFIPQRTYENDPLQVHRSGWTSNEMRARGYRVIGINGLKTLRGERSLIRYSPKPFWALVSNLTKKTSFHIWKCCGKLENAILTFSSGNH